MSLKVGHPEGAPKTNPQGFIDPSEAFPRKPLDHLDKDCPTSRRGATGHLVSDDLGAIPPVPDTAGEPVYPHNQKTVTPSGHIIEYDDTPGQERINIQHLNGSKVSMLATGDVVMASKGSSYRLVARNENVTVQGSVNLIVESNMNVRVQGDVNFEVDGDLNQTVHGNRNTTILGDDYTTIYGNHVFNLTGLEEKNVTGNVVHRYLSHYLERTVGNHTSEYGGNWTTTIEGYVSQMSYGEFNGSYHGGLVTFNGVDKDGEAGEGTVVAYTIHNHDIHSDIGFFSGDLDVSGNFSLGGCLSGNSEAKFSGTVHTPLVEGTAQKSNFALGATIAGSLSSPTPVTPSPQEPDSADPREEEPTSDNTVVDVTGTSLPYIQSINRTSVTGYAPNFCSYGEMVSRCRNPVMRSAGKWLQDHVDKGIILESITSSNPPNATLRSSTVDNVFNDVNLKIMHIPDYLNHNGLIGPQTQLSKYFYISHMLGGDYHKGKLKASGAVSLENCVQNMQLLAMNVLDPLFDRFDFSITEGLYTTLLNETIGGGSITAAFAEGRAVAIQFPNRRNSYYFQAASWIHSNLVFDKLILSYVDFDPHGINEPTLIVSINNKNANSVSTEWNYQTVEEALLDLSDGS